MKREFDVVVVGGGPSGLATALAIAGARNTLVVERHHVPRRKSCGGLLGPLSLRFLESIGLEVPNWVRAVPYRPRALRYINLDSGSDNIVPNTELVNVHREYFDYWLWQEASKVSTCLADAECTGVKQDSSPDEPLVVDVHNRLTLQRFSVEASNVVVADGAGSPIRHSLTGKRLESAVTVQEAIEPAHTLLEMRDDVAFIIAADITPLYSWLIPKGSYWLLGSAFFGTGGIDKRFSDLKGRVARILDLTGRVVWRDVARVSVLRRIEQVELDYGRIQFVGEAAGLLNQATGEGLSFALQSGLLCAAKLSEQAHLSMNDYEPLLRRLQDSLEYSLLMSGNPLLLREYMLHNQGF